MGRRKRTSRFRATDLPHVRDQLVAGSQHVLGLNLHPPLGSGPDVLKTLVRVLPSASMWWASRSMTRLAVQQGATLPEWTPHICRPESSGLLIWDGDSGASVTLPGDIGTWPVVGVVWHPEGTRMALHLLVDGKAGGIGENIGSRLISSCTLRVAAGASSLDLIAGHWSTESGTQQSTEECRSLCAVLGATWLLMQQPTIADRVEHHRDGSRRPVRPGDPAGALGVQVIDLRRIQTRGPQDKESSTQAREYTHRWWVRGHWRQQACGPGRAHRKPVYVMPHVRGPEEAPLWEERVNAWRR